MKIKPEDRLQPAASEKRLTQMYEKYSEARREFLCSIKVESQREPRAEFAEQLVAAYVGGWLSPDRNQPGWDVCGPDGDRIQVKTLSNNQAHSWKNGHDVDFSGTGTKYCDRWALVVFDEHQLSTLLIFPRSTNHQISKLIGKRDMGDSDTKIRLTKANVDMLESKPAPFRELGMEIKVYRSVDRVLTR